MAVFRLHRKEWEKGNKRLNTNREGVSSKKQKREHENSSMGIVSGGGRKGVSSGLGMVLKRAGQSTRGIEKWWEVLDGDMLEAG
jgi:hypothetical protein